MPDIFIDSILVFIKYLVFISIIIVLTFLITLFINKSKPEYKEKIWINSIIITSVIGIILIYWYPPMRIYDCMKVDITKVNTEQHSKEYLIEEFKKVSNEIAENSQDNKSWFYSKLIMVGALIGAMLSQVLKKGGERLEFITLIGKKYFLIIIGLAFVLAAIIDIQIRQNMLVTNQLGSWIAYQFEPFICKNDSISNKNESKTNSFIGWESYLRVESTSKISIDSSVMKKIIKDTRFNGVSINDFNLPIIIDLETKTSIFTPKAKILKTIEDSMKTNTIDLSHDQKNIIFSKVRNSFIITNSTHTDEFYSIVHFPAFHILTWFLYAFYLICFYRFIMKNIIIYNTFELGNKTKHQYRGSLNFLLWTINIVILTVAILSRAQSGIFEMRYSLLSDAYTTPMHSGIFNLFFALIFIVSPNTIYYYKIRKKYLKIE